MNNYIKEITVLYVEDDLAVREGYERALNRWTKDFFVAGDGEEGVEIFKQKRPDIVISDIKMPKKNGIEMAKEIKKINPEQIIIFTTAHTESSFTLEALELQVDGYITKPVDKRILKSKLNTLARNIIMERENIKKTKILQGILDSKENITILTDFENIEFASNSFLELFDVKDKNDFSRRYNNILEVFTNRNGYIFAKTKEDFLQKYNYAKRRDQKLVSIGIGENQKSFYISMDNLYIDNSVLYLISLTDITLFERDKLQAIYEATHDFLTGVFNRAKFTEFFEMEFLRSKRYGRSLSIAMLDIDYFKRVNDTYGHLVGDDILKELANFCSSNIRKTDFFARWGGEEFIIVMSETDEIRAKEVCDNMRQNIKKIKFLDKYFITVSIGISQMKGDDSIETLLKRVDDALYEAKNRGRDRVVVG